MFHLPAKSTVHEAPNGRHVSRRDCLVFGGLASLGICTLGRSIQAAPSYAGEDRSRSFGSAKRCVLIWLDGGPSHLETFDPKPDAPQEVRGPLGVIKTGHAGISFGEGLPQLASRTNEFSIIRSMTSPVGEHNLATNYALSGHIPGGRATAPAFMLPASKLVNSAAPFPAHIAIPNFSVGGGSKLQGFLDDSALPWSLGSQPSDKQFLERLFRVPEGVDAQRLSRRQQLMNQDAGASAAALSQAIDMLSSPTTQRAFDIGQESAGTRKRYGNKAIGQNCLLARRLLESGVPIVTINNKGWDTHDRLHERLHAGYTGAKVPVGLIPSMDLAVSALLDDLRDTGLIEETLVIVMGEFGRTPKINTLGGRDHWPRAYSVLLAGAGVRAGEIYGSSDRVGENARDNPVTPSDLVATLYHLLGIAPHQRIDTPDGQQMTRVPEEANIVTGVLA